MHKLSIYLFYLTLSIGSYWSQNAKVKCLAVIKIYRFGSSNQLIQSRWMTKCMTADRFTTALSTVSILK